MPDLDIIRSGRAPGWGTACSLVVRHGNSVEAVTAAARALASELRRSAIEGVSVDDFNQEARRVLERSLLGPTRGRSLQEVGIDEVLRRERAILDDLRPDIEHLYAQVTSGRKPRARARGRLSATETLSLRIATTKDSLAT